MFGGGLMSKSIEDIIFDEYVKSNPGVKKVVEQKIKKAVEDIDESKITKQIEEALFEMFDYEYLLEELDFRIVHKYCQKKLKEALKV